MVQALDSMYQIARELLRKGKHGTASKCHYIRGRNTVPKFSNHTFSVISPHPGLKPTTLTGFLRIFTHKNAEIMS